jgi:hypothetical protein
MNNKLTLFLAVPVSALLLEPTLAHADFGARGTIVIESELDLDFAHQSVTSPGGSSSSRNELDVGIGGRYFVADHVNVGVSADVLYRSDEDDDSQTILGISVMAGYQHRLGARLHLWPQAAVAYARATTSSSLDVTVSTMAVSAYAPVAYEIADHVMVGWGPTFTTSLHTSADVNGTSSDVDKFTIYGTSAFIAGWF